MDIVNAVVEIISNLGFPAAVCVGSFWLLNKEREDHKAEVDTLREAVTAGNSKLTEALNNNTLAMQRLVDKIGGIQP